MEFERSISKARQNKRSPIPSDVTFKYTKESILDLCTFPPSCNKNKRKLSGYFLHDHIVEIKNGTKNLTDRYPVRQFYFLSLLELVWRIVKRMKRMDCLFIALCN